MLWLLLPINQVYIHHDSWKLNTRESSPLMNLRFNQIDVYSNSTSVEMDCMNKTTKSCSGSTTHLLFLSKKWKAIIKNIIQQNSNDLATNLLKLFGLENSMDCIVHEVAKSQTRLSHFHILSFLIKIIFLWCNPTSEKKRQITMKHVDSKDTQTNKSTATTTS